MRDAEGHSLNEVSTRPDPVRLDPLDPVSGDQLGQTLLQAELIAVLVAVGETHHLVLDRRTVPRPASLDGA